MGSKILGSKISELVNKKQNKLVINELESDVVQKMLEFIYDEKVDLGKDTAFIEELLMAAGKYEIEKLKVSII
jgi:hypothetical protein